MFALRHGHADRRDAVVAAREIADSPPSISYERGLPEWSRSGERLHEHVDLACGQCGKPGANVVTGEAVQRAEHQGLQEIHGLEPAVSLGGNHDELDV